MFDSHVCKGVRYSAGLELLEGRVRSACRSYLESLRQQVSKRFGVLVNTYFPLLDLVSSHGTPAFLQFLQGCSSITLQRIRRELQILQAFFARDRTRADALGVSEFGEDMLTILGGTDSRQYKINATSKKNPALRTQPQGNPPPLSEFCTSGDGCGCCFDVVAEAQETRGPEASAPKSCIFPGVHYVPYFEQRL